MSDINQFEGNVWLSHLSPEGVPLGYFGPVECTAFVPSRTTEDATNVTSRKKGIHGQTIHSIAGESSAALSMAFIEQPVELLALAFASKPEQVTVSAGTVSDEEVVIGAVGAFKLAQRNILASPAVEVVEDTDTDPETYVLGEDYVIDNAIGMIRILPGGAIAQALATAQGSDEDATITVLVSYSYGALSATAFDGETVKRANLAVLFDGRNRVSGKDFSMEYYHLVVDAPDEIFDLMSLELITLTIAGDALTPEGKTAPYRVLKSN
jgi:hypothetical protein